MITIDDVRAAATRLEGVAHRTPVLTSRTLDGRIGARVFLKAENFQRMGAFKFRGAYNAVSSLSAAELERGVITTSSGNHAQAIALAARLCGATAMVVMPIDAPANKAAATEAYGASLVRYDRYVEDREALVRRVADETGRMFIPPYDHPLVMAGQGTAALELVEDVPDLDALLVCVGGGGLLAGCATAAAALVPGIRIFGVEPEAGDDHRRSRMAGQRVTIPVPRTIADGQQTDAPGELTWPITNALCEDFVTVTDDQIIDTMRFLFERMKLVVEPSGASALAALFCGAVDLRGLRVGVTISGGNIDVARCRELFD
ncbi:MAG: pyridoxal-phosphate dependent enzyme [Actinomycetota bacterium]|nr:pyridoxal-phosphate dependent enzyme [Actinomycetota bacterium]